MANQTKSVFDKLSAVKIAEKVEKKGQLSYLSWAHAWAYAKKLYPSLKRTVYETEDGMNYFTDGNTAWVKVGVDIEGTEYIDYLPIMNTAGRPRSIKLEQITSFDVNTSIQRSTVKALALHGLGLSVYAGEDLLDTAPVVQKTWKTLTIDDENWDKVLAWIVENKEMGLRKLIDTLSKKYKVSESVVKEINKHVKG